MGKVSKISTRLNFTRLAKIYPRIERENKHLAPEHITEEMAPFVPPCKGDLIYGVTKEAPFADYELATELDLEQTLPIFNSLLLYRILKLLYGQPDVLGAYPNISSKTLYIGAGVDWGYIMRVQDDLYAEIRSIHTNACFRLRFWIAHLPDEQEQRKPYVEKMERFYKDLIETIEKNTHLFNEEQEIDEEKIGAIYNIFSERYRSADEIFSLAKMREKLGERKEVTYGETLEVSTRGSLYTSSAILFVVSLESLINTIIHLLLKPEFRAKEYKRATVEADLELRLVSAHLFCEGFKRQILVPHSDLWQRFLKLRPFRNDVVHGNITPDDYLYYLREDVTTFIYGMRDFRGRKAEEKAKRNYPTFMARVNEGVVSEIKETVDMIIQAIVDSADEDRKGWISSWLWEAIIPNFHAGEHRE